MATCGVYSIQGPDGRQYVGQSMHIERRFFSHYAALRAEMHPCHALQDVWSNNPCGNFKFSILCETDPFTDDRFAIEQTIMTRVRLYNEYRKIIRTCAWFPSYFTDGAFDRCSMVQKVNIITPSCEWFGIPETGYGWSLRDALARDNSWYIGVITDSQKWQGMRSKMRQRFGFIAYNPTEHFKRLSQDVYENMPRARPAFSPYILMNLKRGEEDFYTFKEELVPISMTTRGYVQSISPRHIDVMNWQEDHCEFISTEKERNNAMRIHCLRNQIEGAKLLRSDKEMAVLFKKGTEYLVSNVDIADFYEQAVLTA
jgi:hypothetical protein